MKSKIFIGSSAESLNLAKAIQIELERHAYVTIWSQDIFKLTSNALDDLLVASTKFDFAIFVFSPDDLVKFRGSDYPAVRDNVVFELGLFIGRFGSKARVFILKPRHADAIHFPSDLSGVTFGEYDNLRDDGNLQAIVSPFCTTVLNQISELQKNGMLSLEGKWSERWWVLDKEDNEISFEDKEVLMEQFGNNVKAQFTFSNRTYLFEGVIEQMRFVTGTWRDVAGGPTYSGAFQLIININADTMYGRWIGFGARNNSVNNGIWEWKRLNVEKYPSEYPIIDSKIKNNLPS
jgi:hypothetical protein